MATRGHWKNNLICLFLFVCHLPAAGEIPSKGKGHLEICTNFSLEAEKGYAERDSSKMLSSFSRSPSRKKILLNSPSIALALQVDALHLVPKGSIWFHIGLEQRPNWQAPISAAYGDLYRYGTLRIDLGLAENISMQIRGAIKQTLKTDSRTVLDDTGDFSVATIVRILPANALQPALGFRIETKLPNTNQDRGIGNNTTDIAMAILVSKPLRSILISCDIGLVILTAPKQINDQNDVLVYGLNMLWNLSHRLQLAGEINGFTSTRKRIPLGTEDRSAARIGFARKWPKFAVEILAAKGLVQREGDWGITAGLSTQLNLFK
jgi:hypothetical protein